MVLWMTGIPGSGKTTLAKAFKKVMPDFIWIDGDVLRKGVNSDLDFSHEGRSENMRRVRELCKINEANGFNTIVSCITPFENDRLKAIAELDNCKIIYLKTDLTTCMQRKAQLYAKHEDAKLFTEPKSVDLVIDTQNTDVNKSLEKLIQFTKLPSYNDQHLVFIGRWNPLHSGHKMLILKKYYETRKPVLVLVRHTKYDHNINKRVNVIREWLLKMNIIGRVQIIPDISGVYYGRNVGYEIQEIQLPASIKKISGTKLRLLKNRV